MSCSRPEKITLYVDPHANGIGTGEADAPFASLALAWETAKAHLASPVAKDVTLSLSCGTHLLGDTLSFRGRSLNPHSTLTVEGEGGEAVITAAVPFDACLFEKVGENLYAARLAGMGKFRNLLVDGKLATLAHMGGKYVDEPDVHHFRFDRTFDAKDPSRDAREQCKMYLAEDLVRPLVGDKTSGKIPVRCAMHCEYEWVFNVMHIVLVDLDDVAVYEEDGVKETHIACYFDKKEYKHFAVPAGHEAGLTPDPLNHYHIKTRIHFLSDHLAFVRKENDYYYDAAAETLYYYTEGDVTSHTFACAKLDYLFRCEDLRNVTFRGITFTGTDYLALHESFHAGGQASATHIIDGGFPHEAAIYSKNAYGVTVENCRFAELGCEGISFSGRVEDLVIKNCRFENIGSAAIRAGEPRLRAFDREQGNDRVLIENNYVVCAGRELWASPAIMLSSSRDLTVTRNTVHDIPYTGISLGWCWAKTDLPYGESVNLCNVTVSYNYVYDYMKGLADGGAIYILGGNAPREDRSLYNVMEGNAVVMTKHTGNSVGGALMGIYYDAAATSWHSRGNAVVAHSLGADPTDENPGYTERFLYTFRERRDRTCHFFSQRCGDENYWAYNILHEDNWYIRCRATEPDKQELEAAWDCMREVSNVQNVNMHYVRTWDALSADGEAVLLRAGCDGHHPDLAWLRTDRY